MAGENTGQTIDRYFPVDSAFKKEMNSSRFVISFRDWAKVFAPVLPERNGRSAGIAMVPY